MSEETGQTASTHGSTAQSVYMVQFTVDSIQIYGTQKLRDMDKSITPITCTAQRLVESVEL